MFSLSKEKREVGGFWSESDISEFSDVTGRALLNERKSGGEFREVGGETKWRESSLMSTGQ